MYTSNLARDVRTFGSHTQGEAGAPHIVTIAKGKSSSGKEENHKLGSVVANGF